MNLKFQKTFQQAVVLLICTALVIPTPLIAAQSPAIVPDGRTQTTVTSNAAGTTTDVRTNTVNGVNAYNSFDRFNVPGGNTTNLHVPDAAKNLVNVVNNERTQIDGILNSYKAGQIGGNVFFLNPHGIVIGSSGIVNVGSLHLQTPTKDYIRQLINKNGQISAVHEQMLFSGSVPISPSGLISVKGTINAIEEIQLTAGDIDLARGSQLLAGRQVQVNFGDLVNIGNLNWGNDLVVSPEGKIQIVATNDVSIAGQVGADATAGKNAGEIEIRAGNDVNVNTGAEITARGTGANSNGGSVVIFADRNSSLTGGALVDVSAVSGRGGFLEFSALDTVNIQGNGLRSSAGGTILIDPKDIVWNGSNVVRGGLDYYQYSSNGADLRLEADNLISLTNVVLSSRLVGSDNLNDHLTGQSIGHSGKITLQARAIELNSSYVLSFATGTWNAGDIIFLATNTIPLFGNNMTLEGTKINATAQSGTHGNVTISVKGDNSLLEWGNFNLDDPFTPAEAKFKMDSNSLITGRDVEIKASADIGMMLDFDKFELPDDQKNALTESLAKTINGIISGLAGDINGMLPAGIKFADARIQIDGNITATGKLDIGATAKATSVFNNAEPGVAWSVSVLDADSQVLIGKNLAIGEIININAGGDVKIHSTAQTTIKVTEKETNSNKIPFDIAFSLGHAKSTNIIDIAAGANITSTGGDISIKAQTDRSHALSVSGGSAQSYMGLVVGILIGDAQTEVIVDGVLDAKGDVILSAETNTKENSVSTIAKMQGKAADVSDWEGVIKMPKSADDMLKDAAKKLFSIFNTKSKNTNATTFEQFGAAGAVSFTHDYAKTNITIGSNTRIISGADVKISAQTVNQVTSSAFSLIGEYKVKNNEINKDFAIAASTPIVVMNNSTSVFVESKEITASGIVDITAKTKIPFIHKHPIYDLFKAFEGTDDGNAMDDTVNITDKLLKLITSLKSGDSGNYFGLASGFLNTWGQSSAKTDEFGGAAMITYLDVNNTTIAQIAGGTITAADLNVNATTTVELANLVGSFAAVTDEVPEGGFPDILYINDKYGAGTFDAVYGAGDKGGAAGGAVLWSNIDSTTIARIDGGEINVSGGDIDVKAETKSIDIGIAIGAGRSGKFDLDLMANLSFYDSYTLAKIDDAVKVTANNVFITADDAAYRIGLAGSHTSSSGVGIGISGTSSVMLRDAHAVWGKVLNADGTLATIKGDDEVDEDAYTASVVKSVVHGNVNVKSNLHGLNLILSEAGVATSDSQVQKAKDNKRKEYLWAILMPDSPSYNKGRTQYLPSVQDRLEEVENQLDRNQFGLSGAVVVSYMNENSSAGISGNVDITSGDVKVEALNSIYDVAVGGAGVLQKGAGNNTGIAGGVAVNILDGSTVAYIQPYIKPNTKNVVNETLITYETLKINAERTGNVFSGAIGGTGSFGSGGVQFGGNATFNFVDDDTFVRIQNAYLQKKDNTVGDITATATNSAGIYSLGGGLAVGGSTSIGASAAYNYLGLNTHTNIINSVIDAGSLKLFSGGESSIVTIALGGGVGNGTGGGGTIAVVISDSKTSTSIYGSNITLSGNMIADAISRAGIGSDSFYANVVKAIQDEDNGDNSGYTNEDGFELKSTNKDGKTEIVAGENGKQKEVPKTEVIGTANLGLAADSPKIVTAALAVGAGKGEGVAVGANVAVNILKDTTSMTIAGSTIKSGGASQYTAETNGGIFAVGIGVAGSTGGVAVSGNVGVNIVGGSTAVEMTNNKLTSTDDFTAQARNASGITGIGVNVAGTGGPAGIAASVAYNQIAHGTTVVVDNTKISGASVDLNARNDSGLVSALLSIGAASGAAGVGVSLAINTIGGLTASKADFTEAKIEEAKDKDGKQQDTAKSSETDENKIRSNIAEQFGLESTDESKSVIDKIGESENITQVVITNGSEVKATHGDVNLNARNSGDILSIAIGAGFGSSAGVGAAFAYNNIGSVSGITTHNATVTSENAGLKAESDSANRIIAVSVGMGGGGTAGIGAGVAVNNLSGTNKVSFTDTTTTTQNDISLFAKNRGDIISVTGGLAGGGAAGVGASVSVNLLKGDTTANIIGGTTTSKTDSVSVKALNKSGITSVAVAGAGGGAAGIAGAVAVNLIKGTTTARIGSSDPKITTIINSAKGVNIDALSKGNIISVAVGAAGAGTAAVALDVAVNTISRTTGAYLENARLPKQNGISTDRLHILADSNHGISSTIVGLSGAGVAAVNVLVGVNTIKGITEAIVKNSKDIYADSIDVAAKNNSEFLGVSVSVAVSGIAAAGVQTNVNTLSQTVKTVIENSKLYATSGNLVLDARDVKTVNSNTIGIAGSGIAGVSGAVSVIVTSGTTEIGVKDSILQAYNDLIVNAVSATELRQISGVVGVGGIAGVGVGVGVNVFGQKTLVNIDDSTLKSLFGKIDITGSGTTHIARMQGHSVGGGFVGVAGTVFVTVVNDKTEVEVTGGSLTAEKGNVEITAESVFLQTNTSKIDNTTIGGAGLGVVGVGAGVNVLVVRNGAALITDTEDITARDIMLNAALTRDVETKTYAGGGGLVGVATTVSVINMGGKKFDINGAIDDNKDRETLTDSVDKASQMSAKYADVGSWNSDVESEPEIIRGSALISIGGTLNATGDVNPQNYSVGSITANATTKNTVDQNVHGFAAGLGAAGAAVGVLNLNDDVSVTVKDNASLTAKAMTFDANVKEKDINLYVMTGANGARAGGAAVASAKINLDSNVTLGEATFFTDTLAVNVDGILKNVLVNSVADISGGVGIIYPSSRVNVTEKNTITLAGTFIDAWGTSDAVRFVAGQSADKVNATAYLYNYTALPLSLAASANAYMNQNDAITFGNNAIVKSVGNIIVEAGIGSKTSSVVGYSEATSIYQEIVGFFTGSSAAIKGGNGSKGFKADSGITLAGAELEAGQHWNTEIFIGEDGKINWEKTNDWVANKVKTDDTLKTENALVYFKGMIQSLEDKIRQQEQKGESTEAFDLEIKNLTAQLKYYLKDEHAGLDLTKLDLSQANIENLKTYFKDLHFVNISGEIIASAGDIYFDAAKLVEIGNSNNLIARHDPSITITNDSVNSLDLAGLSLDIPYREGGRMILNGTIIDNSKKENIGLANTDITSVVHSSEVPKITVYNLEGGDLFLRNGSGFRNPNGIVEILSKGSIWMANSIISAKDITIKTEGSFYQSYQDGLYSTAGNPMDVGTEAYDRIQEWIDQQLLFGGMTKEMAVGKRQDAAYELKAYVSNSNWEEVFNADGSLKYPNDPAALDKLKPLGTFASDWEATESSLNAAFDMANDDYTNTLGKAAGMKLDKTDEDAMAAAMPIALEKVFGSEANILSEANASREDNESKDGYLTLLELSYLAEAAVDVADKIRGELKENEVKPALDAWKRESDRLKRLIADDSPAPIYDSNGIISNISALKFSSENAEEFLRLETEFNDVQTIFMNADTDYRNKLDLQSKINTLNTVATDYAIANKAYVDELNSFCGKMAIYSRANEAVAFASSNNTLDKKIQKDLQEAVTAYTDALNYLQAYSTTASWIDVFGQDGHGNVNLLVDKTSANGEFLYKTHQSEVGKYTDALSDYEINMRLAATNYLERNVKTYKDINNGVVDSVERKLKDIWVKSDGDLNSSVDSVIYGGRSVFISAEILNVNGLIKSGVLDYTGDRKIDLSNTEVRDAIVNAVNEQDISRIVYGKEIDDNAESTFGMPKVTVVIDDFGNKHAQIEHVQANAGNVTLYGNIISTGNGIIEVSDGYGSIDIIGNADYGLILKRVDAGLKSEGQIHIVDTSKRDENDQSWNAIYTRGYDSNTKISTLYVQTGYGDNIYEAEKEIFATGGSYATNGQYKTKFDRWLQTFSGNQYTLTVNYYYEQKRGVVFGIEADWLARDPGYKLEGVTASGSIVRLPSGTFLMELDSDDPRRKDLSSDKLLVGVFTRDSDQLKEKSSKNSFQNSTAKWYTAWCGQALYRRDFTQEQVYTDIFETYMNASHPIDISFVGSLDVEHSNISITGAKSVIINDLVRAINTITIETASDITTGITTGGFGSVEAKNVNLESTNGGIISGHDGRFKIEAAIGGTTLTAKTGGNINLNVNGDALIVDTVSGNNVDIMSSWHILQAQTGTGIATFKDINDNGGNLTLVSGGRIGHMNGKADMSPQDMNSSQMFNFDVANNAKIEAIEQIDAYFNGNLYVDEIVSTAGNVNLYVTGDILDSNDFVQDDPNSDLFKLNLWNELGLMDDVGKSWDDRGEWDEGKEDYKGTKWSRAVDDLVKTREQEYLNAWTFLPGNIDDYDVVAKEFHFNEEAKKNLAEDGWSTEKIAVEEIERTHEYRDALENAIGYQKKALSQSFDEYVTVTEAEKLALKPTGTWTEEMLLNQLTGVLFADAGTRMNTTSTMEAANISGKDVTIYSGGAIGESTGVIEPITITDVANWSKYAYLLRNLEENNEGEICVLKDGKLVALTSDELVLRESMFSQRRALADAEWDDLKFYGENDVVIKQQDFETMAAFFEALERIEVSRYDNINITATNTLKTESGGWTNIGSQGDIEINNSTIGNGIVVNDINDSGQALRLKTDGSIFVSNGNNTAINTRNAVLEAAGGVLGGRAVEVDGEAVISNSPLRINLTGDEEEGWITARGTDGVYLSFVDNKGDFADAYLREVGSWGDVHLAAASFFDALPNIHTAKIAGKDIVLTASGDIGNAADTPLLISQAFGGSLTILKAENVFLENKSDLLNIVKLIAGHIGGDPIVVNITADGDLALTNAKIKINGDATFHADSDVIMSGGDITIGGTWDVIADNNIFATFFEAPGFDDVEESTVIKGKANLGNMKFAAGDDISIDNWILTVLGTLTAAAENNLSVADSEITAGDINLTAENNITITDSDITAGDTTMTAVNGDLAITGGMASSGDTQLVAGNDVSITNWVLNTGKGTLDLTAENNITITDSDITAGDTTMTAVNGDLTITGGTASLGDTRLVSGNDISVADWMLTVLGTLDAASANNTSITNSDVIVVGEMNLTAENDLSITDSDITAGDTAMTVVGGGLTVIGGTADLGDARLVSGKDILINGLTLHSGTLDAAAANDIWFAGSSINAGNMNLAAENNLSLTGSNITAGDTTMTAANGDLIVANGTANLGDAQMFSGADIYIVGLTLNSGAIDAFAMNDIRVANSSINAGDMDLTAVNNLSLADLNIVAGNTTMTAVYGDFTVANVKADLDDTQLNSNNDISLDDLTLNSGTLDASANNLSFKNSDVNAGNMDLTAENSLSLTGSDIVAGDIIISAANGDLTITNGTAALGNAQLISSNDISITGLTLNSGTLDATAANNLSFTNSNINAGDMGLTAANNLSLAGLDIAAGDTNITAVNGGLTVADVTASLGDTRLISGDDVSVDGSMLTVGGSLGVTAANSISLTDSGITAGDTAMTAVNGDLTITEVTANLGDTRLISGGDTSVSNLTLGVAGALDAASANNLSVADSGVNVVGNMELSAGNNISLTGSDIVAGDTAMTADDGDLTIAGGTADLGNTRLISGGNISIEDFRLTAEGALDAVAGNNLSVVQSDVNVSESMDLTAGNNLALKGSKIAAGDTTMTAIKGDLTVSDGTADLGSTRLISGGNVSITGWMLNVMGTLDATAAKNLSVTNSHIKAGDTTLTATGGDLVITNSTANLGNAQLTSGRNVAVSDSRFDLAGYLNILAANHLTLSNFWATALTAKLKAKSYTLSDWHIFADEVWVDGTDLYNDPRFSNSIVYDRIIRKCKEGIKGLYSTDGWSCEEIAGIAGSEGSKGSEEREGIAGSKRSEGSKEREGIAGSEGSEEREERRLILPGSGWLPKGVDYSKLFKKSEPVVVPVSENSRFTGMTGNSGNY